MRTLTESELKAAWAGYMKAKAAADANEIQRIRDMLVEHFLPIVKFNAERIHAKLPSEVDIDDLSSAGLFGLMDAIKSFDLERGVKFETYCSPRIRGAILDELRNLDWVPRLVRTRAGMIEQARKGLQSELGRLPNDQEIARHLSVGKEEFKRIKRDANATSMLSLSRKLAESNSGEGYESDFLRDPASVDPVDEVQKRDLHDLITRFLDTTEQLVLVLYYFEGMTMKEIGSTLDLSESRVSQMHSAILERLRRSLGKNERTVESLLMTT